VVNPTFMPDIVSGVPIDPVLEALTARLGPLAERRIPVYHLDEIEAVAQALASAWAQAAPADLLARLAGHPAGEHLLAPAVVREEESGILLRILAPELVCRAFDDAAGHLDSHTEFGR
jgi:hypothetical protein